MKFKIFKKILKEIAHSIILFVVVLFIAFVLFRWRLNINAFPEFDSGFVLYDFFNWLKNLVLTLDFGHALEGAPVIDLLLPAAIITLLLAVSSLFIGLILSLLIGWYWSKNSKNSLIDTIVRLLNLLSTTPLFLAAFLIALSIGSFTINIYLVPIIVLTIFDGFLAEMINFIKIRIDEISSEQFISALDLRGGNTKRHILKHIFQDLISVVSSKFLGLIGGAIVVEYIFRLRGLGTEAWDAIQGSDKDYTLFMGILVFIILFVIVFNFIVSLIKYVYKNNFKIMAE